MNQSETRKLLENKLAEKLKNKSGLEDEIGAAIAIVLEGEGGGRFVIDLTKRSPKVKLDERVSVATTVSMTAEDFRKMMDGELSPQSAFLNGRISFDGDLGLAIKLGKILS